MMRRRAHGVSPSRSPQNGGTQDDHKVSNKKKESENFPIARILVVVVLLLFWFFAPPGTLGNLAHSLLHPSEPTVSHHGKTAGSSTTSGAAQPEVNTNKFSLISPEQDKALEFDSNTGLRYHLIFSTDCSTYQQWQSYLVYYTALKVGQPGHVTRIASGCDEEGKKATQTWFDDHIAHMSSRFHLQLTPKFSGIKDADGNTIGDYKFFNKPFGTKYWLEHSPQIKRKETSDQTIEFDESMTTDVVILIDPDMALLRPITADFSDDRDTLIGKPRRDGHILARKVGPGKPFAQVYGFGTQWQQLNLAHITRDPNSPALSVSQEDGRLFYPVGPPYIATVPDMHKISSAWSRFVPDTYKEYSHLLAEMFAYCIGAAHVELPHQLIDSLMVSSINAGGEGWPLVDALPDENVCQFAKNIDNSVHAVPSVLHLCQRYMVNEWFFSKRKVPHEVFDCDSPLWEEPPDSLDVTKTDKDPKEAKRQAFTLCSVLHTINEAATYFKKNACPTTGNFKVGYHMTK